MATKPKTPAPPATDVETPLSAKLMGELADRLGAKREERLAADKVAAKLKAEEQGLEAMLRKQLALNKISTVGGKKFAWELGAEPTYVPQVTDWPAYYAYIKKNNAWDLLEKRPGKEACRARWDDNKTIPGVEKFPVYKLSRHEVK